MRFAIISTTMALLTSSAVVASASEEVAGGASDAVPELQLTMDPSDLEELYSRDVRSNDLLPGSITFAPTGEEHELRGLRFRGTSSRHAPKKSFSVRFEEPQEFLFGSSRMNLKAFWTDPTQIRETLAMEMWAKLARPAPRTSHFDLTINGVHEGLYTHVERVDEDLLEHAGLSRDGTLVRDAFRANPSLPSSAFGFDLADVDDPEAFVSENFDSRGDPAWHRLVELIDWVGATSAGPEFASGFAERVDTETFVDWLAIHHVIGDVDSFGDDYWLYLDHQDPSARWKVIPWDKDLAFGHHYRGTHGGTANDFFSYEHQLNPSLHLWGNELVRRFLQTPQLREALDARVRELSERFLASGWLASRADELIVDLRTSIERGPGQESFSLHPQNHHGQLGRLDDHLEVLSDFAELRNAWLDAESRDVDDARIDAAASPASARHDRALLTDARGWSVAGLEPNATLGPSAIEVSVSEDVPAGAAITRTWDVTVRGFPYEAEMDLYYRNEVVGPARAPTENWYGTDDAVGRQDDLVVAQRTGDGWAPLATRINPFSNKISVQARLPAGRTTLAAFYRESFDQVPDWRVPPPRPDGEALRRSVVALTPACGPTPRPSSFADVDASSVHSGAIECARSKGVIVGRPDGTFAPISPVTRGQFASMLARMFTDSGIDLPEPAERRFIDAVGSPHEDAIERLAEAGILRGTRDGLASPGRIIPREQAAALLVRAIEWSLGDPLYEASNRFSDVAGTHSRDVAIGQELGLLQGVTPDRFEPQRSLQRDHAASVSVRAASLLIEVGLAPPF